MHFNNAQWWDCTPDEYYESSRIGSTQISRALGADGPSAKTGDLGRARHLAVFEPDRFASEVVVPPAEVCVGSGEGQKKRRAQWDEENASRIVLTRSQHDGLVDLRDAVGKHPVASRLVRHSRTVVERSMRFDDADTGLQMRGRCDATLDARIFDLKGSTSPDIDDFQRCAVLPYGYHAQAALYSDAFEDITGTAPRFVWIVVSSSAPYRIGVYEVGPMWLELGRRDYRSGIDIISRSRGRDHYPQPWEARPMLANDPPSWAVEKVESREAFARELRQ